MSKSIFNYTLTGDLEIEPLGYRVLVRPDSDGLKKDTDGNYKTQGGIVVVAATAERDRAGQVYGTLVAIGPLAWKDEGGADAWGVKLGDKVSYAKYGGAFIDSPTGERLIVLNDEDIITKVNC